MITVLIQIIFRARNFNTALDIIGIDDVQFRLATRDAPKSSAPSDPFRASSSGDSSLRNVPLINIGLPALYADVYFSPTHFHIFTFSTF